MASRFDKKDPRFAGIKQQVSAIDPNASAQDVRRQVRALYYTGTAIDRRGQATQDAYHTAIQNVGQGVAVVRIVHQGDDFIPIAATDIKTTLDNGPIDWIHFVINDVDAASRLYIPCNLGHATNFFARLTQYNALTAFKIVGYGDAVERADVIVAWFQHADHAKAVGAEFDRNHAAELSGQYPIGAFACSGAAICGHAPEVGGSSVGTEATQYLTDWWQRKVAVQPTAKVNCCVIS